MKVSILMPVKNAEKWLHETLDSILSQTYVNWELICVDDHSSDQSSVILKSAADADSRIQYYRNASSGIVPALQQALLNASGTFVTRMDADDFMPFDRLASMVHALCEESPKTVVTGKVRYISEYSISEGYRRYERWINERIDQQDFFDHLYRECVVASPNWMVRSAEIWQDDIFSKLKYPEDYQMVFLWKHFGYTIKGISAVTLHWREHPERTSRNSVLYDQRSFFQLKLEWFIQLNDLENSTIAVLGVGQKGKIVARFLNDLRVDFSWHDYHSDRYNALINGRVIQSPAALSNDLLILCIYPENRIELEMFLNKKGYYIGKNAWYF